MDNRDRLAQRFRRGRNPTATRGNRIVDAPYADWQRTEYRIAVKHMESAMSLEMLNTTQVVATSRSPTLVQLEKTTPTSGWHTLFRLAGIAALMIVALIPVQALVYILWPPPTNVLDYFSVFQRNAVLGLLDLDLLLIVDQLLIVVVMLGLYIALRHADPSLMLVGIAAGLVGAVLMIVSREATFSMYSLSQQYAAATSAAERAALEAAGQTLLTVYNGTSFSVGYFLTGLATLLVSTVMLRSSLFSRLTGVAGIAAGVTGLVPASMGALGFVLSFLSLIPLIVWLFLVARRFLQLQLPVPLSSSAQSARKL